MIFCVGLIMLVGFCGGRGAVKIGLPSLTGYIVAGLIFGPHVSRLLPEEAILAIKDPVSLVAVSIIAFMLGGDLPIETIKQMGSRIVRIAVIDSIWTFLLVAAGLSLIAGQSLPIALPLAALATSPAPTVVVPIVKELRARGSFTSILLMISALEDITCVILISIAVAISRSAIQGDAISSIIIWISLWEIMGSVLFGAVLGITVNKVLGSIARGPSHLLFTLTIIILGTGATTFLHFSPLITILTMGFVVLNWGQQGENLFQEIETLSGPVMLIFFTTAGAILQPSLIPAAGKAVIIYIGARVISKFSGVYLASRAMKMDSAVCTHLPKCLLSQAGTTLGLTMLVSQQLPQLSSEILTVMISAIIFFEIIAPPLTKNILVKLGEATTLPS